MNTLIEATAAFLWFLTLLLCTAFVVWAIARMAQNLRRNATREKLRVAMLGELPTEFDPAMARRRIEEAMPTVRENLDRGAVHIVKHYSSKADGE